MDAKNMNKFENGTFDVIIDKGTIDCILVLLYFIFH